MTGRAAAWSRPSSTTGQAGRRRRRTRAVCAWDPPASHCRTPEHYAPSATRTGHCACATGGLPALDRSRQPRLTVRLCLRLRFPPCPFSCVALIRCSARVLTGCSRRPDRPDWPAHGGDAGPHAVLAARANHDRERLAPPGGVDLPQRRRAARGTVADPVQPDRRPRRALRHVAAAEGLRARRRDRSRALDVRPVCRRRPTPNALGVNRGVVFWESGDDQRILVAAGQRLYALDARTGKPVPSFGQNGSASLKEGLGDRAQQPVRAVEHPGRDLQGPAHHRHAPVGRPGPVGAGPHPRLRRPHGSRALDLQDDSRSRASSATTPGPPTPGRTSAAPMRGAASPSTRRAAWCSCRPARRPSTSGAATATARTCSPTRCSRSRRPRANASGTTSSCTTISGIATCHRRRCWSR